MTLDDLETRASLEYVLGMCDKYLGEQASDGICQQIVSVAQSDTSCEGMTLLWKHKININFFFSV